MAGLDNEPLTHDPHRHDGTATCRMCSSTDAAAGHGWCAASEGLVCEKCCQRVLLGDLGSLRPSMSLPDLADQADVIITACLGCERGRRWYADQMLHRFTHGASSC